MNKLPEIVNQSLWKCLCLFKAAGDLYSFNFTPLGKKAQKNSDGSPLNRYLSSTPLTFLLQLFKREKPFNI